MKTKEIKITGMDCADCANHVQKALSSLPRTAGAQVFLGAEKAVIKFEKEPPSDEEIMRAVSDAGYGAILDVDDQEDALSKTSAFGNTSILSFILIVISILVVTLIGERLGFFERLQRIVPWYLWALLIGGAGWPVFKNVMRSLTKGRIISHTLMSASVITAIVVGQWATALMITAFMRLGDLIESQTTEKARQSVRKLTQLAPKTARVIKGGQELEMPIQEIQPGDVVVVRPGESIPIDGKVVEGHASVDQSAINGESMPAEIFSGKNVFAASIVQNGMLKINTTAVGQETTFGKIIRSVEEAEANRGEFQRLADRFSGYYLPVVGAIAIGTFVISRNAIAAAAVMVVACSCSFSLATPVAMLASIGSAARQGLLFKGGKYIESLDKADTVFIDKTGTLTIGQPVITDIFSDKPYSEDELLILCASAERYSEHPLSHAVLQKAESKKLSLLEAVNFNSIPGKGITAEIEGKRVAVMNDALDASSAAALHGKNLQSEGKTVLFAQVDGKDAGVLAAEDVLRADSVQSIRDLRSLGIRTIKIISGDHPAAVKKTAAALGIEFEGGMSPEQKINAIKASQKDGHHVVMIGDGINDAPALAQADVSIAMGRTGSDIAIETAHVALLREDWTLIPEAFRIAKRTMRVVKMNILLTGVYNLIGLSLAAFGILPPAVAAAMQSIPDVGIMANSARLLKR